MKQIARAIRRAMERNDLSQRQMADMADIEYSVVSRLLNTDLRMSAETLDSILMAFPNAVDRYEIVQAHIHDEVSAAAREAIEILPAKKQSIRRRALNAATLSAQGEEALRYLLEHPAAVEDLFIDLARAMGYRPVPIARRKSEPQKQKLIA